MAALFTAASSQYLSAASPLPTTGYPFTMAAWYFPFTDPGVGTVLGLFRAAGGTTLGDSLGYDVNSNTNVRIFAHVAGGSNVSAFTTPAQIGFWNFVVLRCISATNRRAAVLTSDGAVTHGAAVTSRVPTSMDTIGVGAVISTTVNNFFDGLIGEFWYTNTDIQVDGLQLDEALTRQLAFGGPFSVPYIAQDIVDYRSLRSALSGDQDNASDYAMGNKGRQVWTNNAGTILGAHPPLPYWYRGPNDQIRTGLI